MKKTVFYLATLCAFALGVSTRGAMNPFSGPSVSIMSPLDGATYPASAELTVLALADHANAQVQSIEFFADETSLGRIARNTLGLVRFDFVRFVWSNPSPGTHRLVARLMGDAGEIAVSRPVTVTIETRAAATEASIVITSPHDGEVFPSSEPLSVYAVSRDPKGYMNRVEFYAGELLIGVSEILFIKAPPDGEPIFHSVEWKQPKTGEIKLWARSRTSRGVEVSSAPVQIRVVATKPFVERRLPAGYSPGEAFNVVLDARPPTGITLYAMEDLIPEGWTAIIPAGQDGDFDKVNRKVKFGPYFDSRTRVLRYIVTPPAGARGEKRFVGNASADGVISSIGGSAAIDSVVAHPADHPDVDFSLSLGEVTAYGLAWRKARRWPVDPNPIPMDYVTRAGALWRGGEKYYFDSAAGAAPGWWVNALPRNTKPLGSQSVVPGSRVGTSIAGSSRIKRLVETQVMGRPVNVILQVNPDPATQAHAVEERIPDGMAVSGISHDGVFDPGTGSLRWGPFFDHEVRALEYQVDGLPAHPFVMRIAGAGSFDGVSIPVSRENRAGGLGPLVRSIRAVDGGVEVFGEGDAGKTHVLESTEDFIHWIELRRLTSAETSFQFRCEGNGDMQRFYRIRQASADE